MSVLVDSPIWSFAFRRAKRTESQQHDVDELGRLIIRQHALLFGPVRQEVLSGVRIAEQRNTLRDTLRAFEDLPIEIDEYELAAELCNECRLRGVQGSSTDFLLCAVSIRYDTPIFTSDRNFLEYARHIGIRLHAPQK